MEFTDFELAAPLRRALAERGYRHPTPIQAAAIPAALAGRDLIGCAQTGTGKTAAFALPTLQRLLDAPPEGGRKRVRALVLAPTRELAEQIRTSFAGYGAATGLRCAAVYGGVGFGDQIRALRRGVEVLVACPGRLIDLMRRGHVDFAGVEVLVLDEADRMLDMGFAPDLERILGALPARRQTLLFSATMAGEVRALATRNLRDPLTVTMTPDEPTAENVSQVVYLVDRARKTAALQGLLASGRVGKAVAFTRTKHGADRLAQRLERGGVRCRAIHGDKSQGARTRAMDAFRSGRITVLIATDIAARGLDVRDISHVVNFDLPRETETYVHRIGRCGRAGASGTAWSLCAPEERRLLTAIERSIGRRIDRAESPAGTASAPASTATAPRPEPGRRAGPSRPGRRRNRRRGGARG